MASISPHNDVAVSAPGAWPAHFGSARDEFGALKSTCGLHLLGEQAKIRLTGKDRVRWLNGMITNNVRDLPAERGVYAFLLNPQGHILGDLTAYNRGDHFLVETDRLQLDKILGIFDHYIIMDDVEVENVSEKLTTIGVTGPNSEGVLKAAGLDLPPLKPLQMADLSWRQTSLTIVRGQDEQYPSYEIWIAPDGVAELSGSLRASGALQVGRDALEIHRIALGIPRYGRDIRERDLPQETEQQRALNFNKGCYIGQEIVERIRSRGNVHRKFTGFQASGPPPTPGTKVRIDDKDVGEITSSASIPAPDGDRTVALGYIRREISAAGKEVLLAESTAVVSQLPFADLLTI